MTMYLEHFGLREAPFRITPHTEFFFAGANRGATLEALLYAITAGEGLVKVTGEVGSGKTMLCRVLMDRLPDTVETIYLAIPSLSRDEMLAAIAEDLGLDTAGANTNKLMRLLQEKLIELHTAGRQVVALIDEAHAMPLATLEEIRLLSNLETGTDKLLQIALFGQPELDAHLALPHMRQLKERITHSFTLAPLPPHTVAEYIWFRLRAAGYHGPELFGAEALKIIAEASEGLTRRINIFADKTLLAAFAAGTHTITADHARAAVSDTQIVVTRRESKRGLAVAGALGLAAGIAIGYTLRTATHDPVGAVAAAPMQKAAAVEPAREQPAQGHAEPDKAVAAKPDSGKAAAPEPPAAEKAVSQDASASAAPAVAAIPVAATVSVPQHKAAGALPADLLSRRLVAGKSLLDDAGSAHFSVQLMVTDAKDRDYLESYLSQAARAVDSERLYLVPAGTPETPRFGVLFGDYADRAQANSALASLPADLRLFRPYVRSLDNVREDARRAQAR
ncbi:MAG TPA: AAA family ATPase [Usitatibacter sp.]|nr:AAA family ATPase [Usitatibacter sp.]